MEQHGMSVASVFERAGGVVLGPGGQPRKWQHPYAEVKPGRRSGKLKETFSHYANDEAMWLRRQPTDAEVAARFAEEGDRPLPEGPPAFREFCANYKPSTTLAERAGDDFLEWRGGIFDGVEDFLLIAAGAMTVMGMADGAGVSVVQADGRIGLYLEE